MNKDLTVGNPSTVLWKFCMPLFGSIIFQQLYNIADSFVAGKFISEEALAAVGNSYEITLIFLAFAFGCNMGCSVTVSRFFGAKQFKEMKTAVYTTLIASGVLCLTLMCLGIFFGDWLLNMIHTPQNIFDDSKLYLDIYVFGLPFVFFYNVSTGIFSALGDSKTPFIFLICSSLSNIAVDILFVTTFNMGVSGVAWATFLCQGISCILAVAFVLKRVSNIKTEKVSVFSWKILGKISIIAIPSIMQQSFVSVGNILIQGVINGFGSSVIAGYAAAVKVNNLVITSFSTISNGVSNYCAQNIGANKNERIMQGFKSAVKMIWTIGLPFVLLYFFVGRPILNVFMENPNGEAMKTGIEFLKILSPFYFIISLKMTADGFMRGASKMIPFTISTFTDLLLRVVLATVLSKTMGTIGIWLAWPISWCIATVMSLLFFANWKKLLKNSI